MDYIENPNAPMFRAHGLHDLDFIGSDGLFTLYIIKKTAGGVLYRETALFVEIPNLAIPPAVALTVKKMGEAGVMPISHAVRRIGIH